MAKKTKPTPTTVRVWTRCYRPFMTGGNVHRSIAAEVPIASVVDLGKGFSGYEIHDMTGASRYVCAVSGGLLGDDLAAIRKDIAECPKKKKKKIMTEQVAKMAIEGKDAELMEPDKF